jgi:predicted NBD/HSP70 family sugar kinase
MANSSYLRRMHQRRIIEAVARAGSTSRAALARATGMSQPTVSRIVDQLLSEQVLAESDAGGGGVPERSAGSTVAAVLGRPSTLLELDRHRPRFAVVQLGVRHTRLSVLPLAIPSEDQWQSEFPTPTSFEAWARELAKAWRPHRDKGLKAVVSLPGVVDERSGKVYLSPNLRWLEDADLAARLADVLGADVVFNQEIRLLALGQLAVEPESGDFLLVDSGNGVGAAAMIGGKLFSPTLPLSGEIGHIPVPGNDRRCGCGGMGCLETLISRAGLIASAAEHGERRAWPALVEHLRAGPLPAWLAGSLESAALDIAGALNLLGLRQVVLTGAFDELPASCVDALREGVHRYAMWARFGEVSFRTAPRRRQAGMVSSALERMLVD